MKRLLDNYGHNTIQINNPNIPIDPHPITLLPEDLIDKIFSSLKDSEIPSIRLTCKFWNERTVCIALSNISEIRNFVNFLNVNLIPTNETQKAAFFQLHESTKLLKTIHDTFHFGQFIQCRSQTKENFFKLLMKLSLESITSLRKVSDEKVKLNCFQHYFELAQLYKRIEQMDQMPFNDLKSATIKRIGIDLAIALGNSEKPKKVGMMTLNVSLLGLKPVLRKESSREDIISAITYILFSNKYEERDALCEVISKTLALTEELDTALQVLQYIRSWPVRDAAHARISKILTDLNDINGALKVTDKIEDSRLKASTFEMIFAATQEPFKIKSMETL